ncbi:MAG: hypothetical protein J3Q66DRAFT_351900 [Benniella sp.]|nr:MAG: hypothetical protein J3Q66DRAFT_351900 [Benniella sp.]
MKVTSVIIALSAIVAVSQVAALPALLPNLQGGGQVNGSGCGNAGGSGAVEGAAGGQAGGNGCVQGGGSAGGSVTNP